MTVYSTTPVDISAMEMTLAQLLHCNVTWSSRQSERVLFKMASDLIHPRDKAKALPRFKDMFKPYRAERNLGWGCYAAPSLRFTV